MATENCVLKPYTHFRLHLRSGESYAGTLVSTRFIGNNLCIVPLQLAIETELDQLSLETAWKAMYPGHPRFSSGFAFKKCRVISGRSNGEKMTFKSAAGDDILLSNWEKDAESINEILKGLTFRL